MEKLKSFLILFAYLFVFGAGTLLLFILITNLVIHLGARPHIYEKIEDVEKAQTALILGAAVLRNGTLSPIFEERVDTAIELYQAKKVKKILASGDNSTLAHNEVNPVRNYLLEKDIPDEDIYLDYAGFDTYSTMYRARDIFQVDSVIIVTQSFHLPRAVFIAQMLGLNASGVSPDKRAPLSNYIREIFANEKAALDLLLHREPKFLGEVIPIPEN